MNQVEQMIGSRCGTTCSRTDDSLTSEPEVGKVRDWNRRLLSHNQLILSPLNWPEGPDIRQVSCSSCYADYPCLTVVPCNKVSLSHHTTDALTFYATLIIRFPSVKQTFSYVVIMWSFKQFSQTKQRNFQQVQCQRLRQNYVLL